MPNFQPSDASGPLTAETASWDFYEADAVEASVPIPTIGPDISWASLHPGRHAAAQQAAQERAREQAQEQADRAAAIRRIEEATSAGLSPLPVGDKEMVLVTSGQESTSPHIRPHAQGEAFYERPWFWPVVIFGVVMGVVSNQRGQ
jgi:hypothetical protein